MTALLLYGSTDASPALRHEVPVSIGDPFLFADVDDQLAVLTNSLERDRIAAALPQARLVDMFELGLRELAQQGVPRPAAHVEIAARAVARLEVRDAVVPGDFPVALADRLRADGVTLTVDDAFVDARRRVKAGAELDGVRAAQAATDEVMAIAAGMLAAAEPDGDGVLRLDGEPLLAERVREALRVEFAQRGCTCPAGMMVVSVRQGYGHEPGSGWLPAGLPIQVDLFPRHEDSACWADMTRTFIIGDPAAEHAAAIAEQERLAREALERARAAIRPGVLGGDLYAATCDLFEAAGYATQRTAPPDDDRSGFQFALGHGVGLEVHEPPGLGMSGAEPFVAGDIVAIEPGLWDRRFGGVRFEDLLLVTDDGCETLTRFGYELAPPA